MILHEKNATAVDRWRLAEDLCEAALVDTVYGDLYLQRARDFLAPTLSEADLSALQLLETEALNLPNRISIAMEQANWMEVKALSSRMSSLKRTLEEKESLRQLGEKIYQPGELPLDPFSPGLQGLAKRGAPRELLHKLSAHLERLQRADADWQEFFAARRSAMAALTGRLSQAPEEADSSGAGPDGSQLKHKAFEALNSGDFEKLEKMAALIGQEEQGATKTTSSHRSDFSGNLPDRTFQFSQEVVSRARNLGLGPVRMEAGSRVLNLSPEDLAPLYRHLWNPAFTDEIGREGAGGRQKEIPLPAHAPAGLRDLVEMYTLYPFVNSGGARFVPVLAEEDVLVEDFDEPDPGTEAPPSALLSALGFDDRRGLSRIRLEKALIERGNAILADIGLDARSFRLVCIPPDVYGRIGPQQGWGRKPLWTHFDGYLVRRNGKLQALAGGDVRFGGLFDLVGISRGYDSDRIIARFAVVQRRRMAAVG
jgi:hypothetical protein